MRYKIYSILSVMFFIIAISGCERNRTKDNLDTGQDISIHTQSDTLQAGTEYNIVIDNFSFSPDTIQLFAGICYQINFENKGSVKHKFLAGKNAANEGFNQNLFDNIEVEKRKNGEIINEEGTNFELNPGEKGSLAFTLTSDKQGNWEMGCFEKGKGKTHFAMGMKGILTVK